MATIIKLLYLVCRTIFPPNDKISFGKPNQIFKSFLFFGTNFKFSNRFHFKRKASHDEIQALAKNVKSLQSTKAFLAAGL